MSLQLAGGLGLFLLGMALLTEGLRVMAGESLRRALVRLTGTPFKAFGSGAQHDHLEIGGGIVWNGGQIKVAAFDGFTPSAGDVYNLMDWYGVASWNTFDSGDRYRVGGETGTDLTLPDLTAFNAALRWDTGLFASHGILVVAVVPEPGAVRAAGPRGTADAPPPLSRFSPRARRASGSPPARTRRRAECASPGQGRGVPAVRRRGTRRAHSRAGHGG